MNTIFVNLENFLKSFAQKNIIVNQDGFIKSIFEIKDLKYFVEYEILNILDNKGDNFLKLNLNQIYKVENLNRQIKLFLDNDTIITLSANKGVIN